MADTSLITKAHLRQTVNATVEAIEAAMYTHPSHTARTSGLYKITVDDKGHVSAATAVATADITALGLATTEAVEQKSQVQIITWEDDD